MLQVLAVLLLAAVAGAVSHVPGGLGVLEAVFIAALGSQVPRPELLAALLAYRCVYYLLPPELGAGGLCADGRRAVGRAGRPPKPRLTSHRVAHGRVAERRPRWARSARQSGVARPVAF